MSEEFVRCSECGNLNIVGTSKCVFCGTAISETAEKEVFDKVDVDIVEEKPETPKIPAMPDIPSTEPKTEEEYPPTPEMPEVEVEKTEVVEKKEKEIIIEDATDQDYSFIRKLAFISLFSILISILHYGLNLLVSILSVTNDDPGVNIFPLTDSIIDYISIDAVSFILGIPFAIAIGYLLAKVIRRYTSSKKAIIGWLSFAIFIDLVINVVVAIGLIYAFNALQEVDILLSIFAGAAFIFVTMSVIFLFIPTIVGSLVIFEKIDKIFFPKKYVEF